MRRRLLSCSLVCLLAATVTAVAQDRPLPVPNYDLAARWMAGKVGKLVFDTTVTPHWAEGSERFWYAFETAQGRRYMLVDPVKRSRAPLWDNARMAALLTGITRIPYDAQHLPIQPSTMKWTRNDAAIRFEVEVPKDAVIVGEKTGTKKAEATEAKKDEAGKQDTKKDDTKKDEVTKAGDDKDAEEPKTTKTLTFSYELATGALTLLADYEPEPKKPAWAQVSPDQKTVVFARGHNLFMMDAASYALARKNFGDATIQEVQLTTDGEEHRGFARRLSEDAKTSLKKDQKGDTAHKDGPRVPAIGVQWARDSKKFSVVRVDQRKVADLWVINSLATPRPKLETYRYAMPGEVNVDQHELLVFDRDSRTRVTVTCTASTCAARTPRRVTSPRSSKSGSIPTSTRSRCGRSATVRSSCTGPSATGGATTTCSTRTAR